MKKILLMMLLTFTTMSNAGEGRYSMMPDPSGFKTWILDTKNGDIKICVLDRKVLECTNWRKNDEDKFYED